MKYICIPIRSQKNEDAKKIAENEFGSMCWDYSDSKILKAYPFDTEYPICVVDSDLLKNILPKLEELKSGGKGD